MKSLQDLDLIYREDRNFSISRQIWYVLEKVWEMDCLLQQSLVQQNFMKIFDELWVSSTNNSESLSLAGTKAVIMEMKEKNTIKHCWKIGKIC